MHLFIPHKNHNCTDISHLKFVAVDSSTYVNFNNIPQRDEFYEKCLFSKFSLISLLTFTYTKHNK